MLEILRVRQCRALVAVVVTLGLVAAACGNTAAETNEASSGTAAPEAAPEPSPDDATADDAGAAEEPSADGDAGEAAAQDEEPAVEEDAAEENLFPDLEVVDITEGSSLNLADELGGGDLPVLLWFWAPH